MHKLVMRFLTATDGKYFTLTVDDLKADENGVPTVTEAEVNGENIPLKNIISNKVLFR